MQKTDDQTTNEFHGYDLFNGVLNPTLKSWNRLNTYFNIKEERGSVVAKRYLEKFSKADLTPIFIQVHSIKERGYEAVRREIMRKDLVTSD